MKTGRTFDTCRSSSASSALEQMLAKPKSGIVHSEHADLDGNAMFRPLQDGARGIVSKRKDKAYLSGPARHWIKVKNPKSPAMLRLQD